MDTKITDAGLAQLAKISSLERLNLDLTKISDAGLEHLKGLKTSAGSLSNRRT